jgi:hypothetical protein
MKMTNIIPALFFTLVISCISSAGFAAEENGTFQSCTDCHSCETPTVENPCLKDCPRPLDSSEQNPVRQMTNQSDLGPDTVIMNELEDIYAPVVFNHKAHARMMPFEGQCSICHHYQEDMEEIKSCRECHTVELQISEPSRIGLKGAYHRQCLNCHEEWDHERSCEVCHEKKNSGQFHLPLTASSELHHFVTRPFQAQITISTEYDEGDQVPFHHERHARKYSPNCVTCHEQQKCENCHSNGSSGKLIASVQTVTDAAFQGDGTTLHNMCMKCHEDAECEYCHGQKPDYAFSHDQTSWQLKPYHQELHCLKCHVDGVHESRPETDCEKCHVDGWDGSTFDHAITGVLLDEVHINAGCIDCHTDGVGKKASCKECHDDKRKYSPEKGFGGSEE